MESNPSTFLRSKLLTYLLACILAFLPIGFKVLAFESEWGRGFLNPYSSVYFSLFDGLLLLSGATYLFSHTSKITLSKTLFSVMTVCTCIALSLVLSPFDSSFFHLLLMVKMGELLLLYCLLANSENRSFLIRAFTLSLGVEAIWALLQLIFQQDLGLQILGEPVLSSTTAQLAKFSVGSFEIIRGYGSFPHPNILGGFLAVAFFMVWKYSDFQKKQKWVLLGILGLGLMASFSRSAILALVLVSLVSERNKIFTNKTRLFSLLILSTLLVLVFVLRGTNLLSDPAMLERLKGYQDSWQMFLKYPLGVGFSHYTLFLDNVSLHPLMPWDYQPVHNIFLLLLNELGLPLFTLGLISLLYVTFQKPRHLNILLLFILFLGVFDHYLLSLEQGRLLLILLLAFQNKNQENHA